MDMITELFNVCDPLKPPPHQSAYVDCSAARGDTADDASTLAQRVRHAAASSKSHMHLLFSGHPGSGKSTELGRLCQQLKCPPKSSSDCFFPVYMDADDHHISRHNVEVTEILLAIIGSVAESLKEEENIHLESSYLHRRLHELRKLLSSPVEIKEAEVPISKSAKLKVGIRQTSIEFWQKVQDRLITPRPPSLIGQINLELEKARVEIRKHGYKDIVIVVDHLDKIPDLEDPQTELSAHYRIFVEGGSQLRKIGAHMVLTVPLSLIRSEQGATLASIFEEQPFVLPTVKVEQRNGALCKPGLELMRQVLCQRFEIIGVRQDEVFDPHDTLMYLCQMSGGHLRNLLMYFLSAADFTDSLPFTKEEVRKGIQRHINGYIGSISEKNWTSLAQLHLDPQRCIPTDDDYQEMLESLSILEYRNGEPWYAVNPVIRESEKFKRVTRSVTEVGGE